MRRIQTILAVGKKEFTELTRYKDWIIMMFIWPLIFPLVYILSAMGLAGPSKNGLTSFKNATGTTDYVAFIVIGVMVWMWVNMTMWNFGTYLRKEQRAGTLESVWLCPINKFDLLIGGSLINILMGFVYVAISVVEYTLIYRVNFTGNLISWLIIFITLIPGVIGLGILFASLVLWLKDANIAVNVVRGAVMILCGISFPVTIMPQAMQRIASIFPFTFSIEAARKVMVNGMSLFDVKEELLWCVLIGTIYFFVGRIVFMAVEKKVKSQGSLDRF